MSNTLLRKFFNASNKDNCPICIDKVNTYDEAFISKDCCCTIFHINCIRTNFVEYENLNCPMCKTELNQSALADVFFGEDEEDEEEITDEEDEEDEDEFMREKDFQDLFCDCNRCEDILKRQRIKIAILDDDIKKLGHLLNEHTELKLLKLGYDTLQKFLCYCISNGSFRCVNFIIKRKKKFIKFCNNFLNPGRLETISAINASFRGAIFTGHNKTAKLVLDNFCISVDKDYLESYVHEFNTEMYDYIKEKCKLDEVTQVYINYKLRN